MTTPSGAVFVARAADGTETDVTADVQTLYDLMIGSMDWGSGFLTAEDAEHVVRVARLGGFASFEAAQKYVDDRRHSDETHDFLRSNPSAEAKFFPHRGTARWEENVRDVPHDHVWSSAGRCMWRYCEAKESGNAC